VGRYAGARQYVSNQPVAFQGWRNVRREHYVCEIRGWYPLEVGFEHDPRGSQFEQKRRAVRLPFFSAGPPAQDFRATRIAVFGLKLYFAFSITPVCLRVINDVPSLRRRTGMTILLLRLLINTGGYVNDTWLITGSSGRPGAFDPWRARAGCRPPMSSGGSSAGTQKS